MSAVSSMLGEILIPIPVLGAIVGNTVGMFMLNISRSYLSSEEQKLITAYQSDMSALTAEIVATEKEQFAKLSAELAKFSSLVSYAFDSNVNSRFENLISRATLVGANTNRMIDFDAGASLFGNGKPVVL